MIPKRNFWNFWIVISLRVIDLKNRNFSILSDFHETQNKWCSCNSKAKYKQKFQIFWMFCLLWVIDGKNVIFYFCQIFMKLKINDVLANSNAKYKFFFNNTLITGDWWKKCHLLILSNFDETENKWCSCHYKAKYKLNFSNKLNG